MLTNNFVPWHRWWARFSTSLPTANAVQLQAKTNQKRELLQGSVSDTLQRLATPEPSRAHGPRNPPSTIRRSRMGTGSKSRPEAVNVLSFVAARTGRARTSSCAARPSTGRPPLRPHIKSKTNQVPDEAIVEVQECLLASWTAQDLGDSEAAEEQNGGKVMINAWKQQQSGGSL